MYCDLNLRSRYSGDSAKDVQLIQLIVSCMEDNYACVGLVQNYKDVILQPRDACSIKPYDNKMLQSKHNNSVNITQNKGHTLKQLTRVTLDVSDGKFLNQIKDENPILQSYDIVAIKPKSEKVFLQICNEIDYFDIITFDCFDKLPFIPKLNIVHNLLQKNIMFELNYSDALQDPNKRRIFISNAMIIIKATKGKNIILSSDCDHWLYHRSPYDLVTLGVMLGMSKDQATHAVNDNPMKAIQHSVHRKSFKGTIVEADQKDIEHFQQKKQMQQDRINKKIKLSQDVYANIPQ